jgi:hypothetical protein
MAGNTTVSAYGFSQGQLQKRTTTSLDDVLTLPDHGADGAAQHVGDEAGEEGLGAQVGVVLLKEGLLGGDELHGSELVAAVLEAGDDGANESALS